MNEKLVEGYYNAVETGKEKDYLNNLDVVEYTLVATALNLINKKKIIQMIDTMEKSYIFSNENNENISIPKFPKMH